MDAEPAATELLAMNQLGAFCQEGNDGLYLNVHAQPGSRRPQLRGLHGDAVKIAIGEAAQDGKANKAIVRLIAKSLDMPVSRVEITFGMSARRKRVLLHGDTTSLKQKLLDWLNANA